MTKPKLRVLVDLSMAARGYCGIAQDVRLLYKALAAHEHLDVTGLIYHPKKFGPWHQFLPPGAPRCDRTANQASFLWALAEGTSVWTESRPMRAWEAVRRFVGTVSRRKVQFDALDVEMYWSVIWRLLFSQTLSPEDLPLVQSGKFLLSNLCSGMIYSRAFTRRRPVQLDTQGYDFLITQGPRPFRVSPGTRQIARFHDLIPLLHPDSRPSSLDIAWLHKAMQQGRKNAYFVCNSQPTCDELTTIYPDLAGQCETIPCMAADSYYPDTSSNVVRSIVEMRRSTATGERPARRPKPGMRYLLGVSTLEPRKNFVGLIQAFNALRLQGSMQQRLADLKLMIVGSPGWQYEPILGAMRELVRRGDLIHLEQVTPDELRVLYSHAEALVFPSHAEGFGLPPLEALCCEAPVIASDIPAHRWVLQDAAVYCNSYDVNSISQAIQRVVASDESASLRAELLTRGRERARHFSTNACGEQWAELLDRLKHDPVPVQASPSISLAEHTWSQRVA